MKSSSVLHAGFRRATLAQSSRRRIGCQKGRAARPARADQTLAAKGARRPGRAQKNAFLRLSFILELLHYYDNQSTESPDVVFAQRLPPLIEQLVIAGERGSSSTKNSSRAGGNAAGVRHQPRLPAVPSSTTWANPADSPVRCGWRSPCARKKLPEAGSRRSHWNWHAASGHPVGESSAKVGDGRHGVAAASTPHTSARRSLQRLHGLRPHRAATDAGSPRQGRSAKELGIA